MAVKNVTLTPSPNGATNFVRAVWRLANGDTGSLLESMDFADGTVQIGGIGSGTAPDGASVAASVFGTGGSVTMEGSNDGVNFFALTDQQGNAITKTASALEVIEEVPRFFRPNCTAGDGTTDITITLWARRNR